METKEFVDKIILLNRLALPLYKMLHNSNQNIGVQAIFQNRNVFFTHFCITNYPDTQRLKITKHLLSNSFCRSGIQEQLSGQLQLRFSYELSSRFWLGLQSSQGLTREDLLPSFFTCQLASLRRSTFKFTRMELATGCLMTWQLAFPTLSHSKDSERASQMETTTLYKLISKLTSYHFCTLLVRSESINSNNTQQGETTQECASQEARILSGLPEKLPIVHPLALKANTLTAPKDLKILNIHSKPRISTSKSGPSMDEVPQV